MSKCKYCNFDETRSCFPTDRFETSAYELSEAVNAIGGGLQLDMDNKPVISLSIHTPGTTYQYGWEIKYCPMCGRKLEVEDE